MPWSVFIRKCQEVRVTYRPTLTFSVLTNPQHIPVNVGDDGVCIHRKFGLERERLVAIKQRHTEHTLKT